MPSFLARFGSLVEFVLSGFDRLRLCGQSRLLSHARGVESYLVQQRILRKDFADHARGLTDTLCKATEASAQQLGLPQRYLNSPDLDKKTVVQELVRQRNSPPRPDGRLALLSCVEPCRFYRLGKNDDGRFELRSLTGKCLHYYHYFDHPCFGLCHVRVQSWFPFTVHVVVNGREWLCRQLDQAGLRYQRKDNLLTWVDDPLRAQRIFDQQLQVDWPTLLRNLVAPIQPLWTYLDEQTNCPYYWMAEQSEWATDFVFKDPADLARLYPRWIRHGLETLQCQDILRYFGKKHLERCRPEEVQAHYADRDQGPYAGTRLKFWYQTNACKIYDKEGVALRAEATVNYTRAFRAFRHTEKQDITEPKGWHDLRKGVIDLPQRAEISQRINDRLVESLATVAETTPLGKLLEPLGKPIYEKDRRRARPLNPLTGADGRLLRLLANGDFLINGFRNRDLRLALHGEADAATCRKQSGAVTRLLALLRHHDLIVKIAKTHRYRLSAQGARIATALSAAHECDVTRLAGSK
jgi:hypothetical protein